MTDPRRWIGKLQFGSLKVRIAVLYTGLFAIVLILLVLIVGGALDRLRRSRRHAGP